MLILQSILTTLITFSIHQHIGFDSVRKCDAFDETERFLCMGITPQVFPEFRVMVRELAMADFVSQDVIDDVGRPLANPLADANIAVRGATCGEAAQAVPHVADPANRVPGKLAAKVGPVDLGGAFHQVHVDLAAGTFALAGDTRPNVGNNLLDLFWGHAAGY